MSLTIVVVLLAALCLTHAAVFRVLPTVLNSGTTYDFIFSGFTKIGFTRCSAATDGVTGFSPLKTDDLF